MRVAKVTTVYPAYTHAFYSDRPKLAESGYDAQRAALVLDSFGWADFWGHALAPLGYEVHEIWANIRPLQHAWASEAGSAAQAAMQTDDWVRAVSLEQVASVRPDILFMDDYTTFSAEWVAEARRRAPSIRMVVGWCGAPFRDASVFSAYDLVLSNIPELVRWFGEQGHRAEHLNHAFDPRVLTRLTPDVTPDLGVTFIGQIERARNAHGSREILLTALARATDLAVFSPVERPTPAYHMRSAAKRGLYSIAQAARAVGAGNVAARVPILGRATAWTEPPHRPIGGPLARALRPPVFGLKMFETLQRSAVTLNSHIDLSRDSASNMRMFEATGAGSCLLTDHKMNLPSLFDPGVEVVTYRSAEECLEKARWLLENEEARNAIARAGQARTLRDHTFASRAPVLDDILRRALA